MKISKLLNEVINLDEIFIEYLNKFLQNSIENEVLINHLEWQISHEELLKNVYEGSEHKLKNCG